MVSFGSRQGAEGWLNSTGCKLDIFLDEERVLYNCLGLQRSVEKVWNMTTINYYSGQVTQGRQLPKALDGVEDDPLQMGGDFSLRCEDGVLVMSHCSTTPKDRPTIEKIMEKLK